MIPPPRPADEALRLEALRRYAVLDTPPESSFDDLTFLAAHVCQAPIALISLVDANRQWFKSKVGVELAETSREVSLCAHAIMQGDLFVVPDALEDSRFADNPMVTGDPKIRFYAGAPLETPEGYRVGTLCVVDYQPRELTSQQRNALQALSRQVVMQLEVRRQVAELARTIGEVAVRRQAQEAAEALARVVAELLGTLETAEVTDRIVASMVHLLRGRRASLFRLDHAAGRLVCVATAGVGDNAKWIGRTLALGEGVSGWALQENRPVSTSAALDAPALKNPEWLRELVREEGLGAVIAVPLKSRTETVGTLVLADARNRVFTTDEVRILATFTDLAALALENAQLYEERQGRLRVTEALLGIAQATSSTLELKHVLRVLAQQTAQALGTTRCSINFWRDGHLVPVMSQFADGHHDPELWAKFKAMGPYRLEQVPAHAEAIRTKRPIAIDDARQGDLIPEHWREAYGIRSALVVPLLRQDEVVGTLNLEQTDGPCVWSQAQIDLAMTIANHAALAAENARLYDQVRGQLAELKETQAQLLQAGKLAALGQLVAGVAHELNNPLAVIFGQAQLLRLKHSDPRVTDRADKIMASSTRAARIIKELQTFARPLPAQVSTVHLGEVVDRVVGLHRQALRVSGIAVEQDIAADVPLVWGDAQQLEQVVLNLILNAEQALAKGSDDPRIRVKVSVTDDVVRLVVSDTGPGIPPDVLPRIFEPFFTTKPVGQGTGLGLSICYRIIEAHAGRIWAESAPGEGATMIVDLPIYAGDTAGEDGIPVSSPVADFRRGHVLVIDDEPDVADTLRAVFDSLGQQVTVALGGERGWERLSAPDALYDLVTLDLKMPDLSGPKLWDRLVSSRSPLVERVVFLTGDTVDVATEGFLRQTGRPVLRKPFELRDLAALLPSRAS